VNVGGDSNKLTMEEMVQRFSNELLRDDHGKGNAVMLFEKLTTVIINEYVPNERKPDLATYLSMCYNNARRERY